MVIERAYAKINLFLDITDKRENGYHNIMSVMQTIDWSDIVKVEKNVSGEILLYENSGELPCDHTNIAYKAASLFLEKTGIKTGITVTLEKRIPIAAGLAGGSADAAAVLRGCNSLFEFPLCKEELFSLAAQIGADVPFCLIGGTKIVRGIGEILEDAMPFDDCFIVCAKLGDGVSTPEAYRILDERNNDFHAFSWNVGKWKILSEGLGKVDISRCCEGLYNIFESAILMMRPSVQKLKDLFEEHGGIAMMSGSGPSVFGIFKNSIMAEKACQKARLLGAEARVCRPIGEID